MGLKNLYKLSWYFSNKLVSVKMEYIVDIQGFRLPINEFIIKELAILPVNNNNDNESARPFNFLSQPPCSVHHKSERERISMCLSFSLFSALRRV